jgi:hypothetical protein
LFLLSTANLSGRVGLLLWALTFTEEIKRAQPADATDDQYYSTSDKSSALALFLLLVMPAVAPITPYSGILIRPNLPVGRKGGVQ